VTIVDALQTNEIIEIATFLCAKEDKKKKEETQL
jgi:hypothetical protein